MATNIVNPAQSQLVVQNYFNLVQAIASKIKRRLPAHVDVDDLVQTGMIGLLEASSRFDPSRMVDFSSYANSRITGAINMPSRARIGCEYIAALHSLGRDRHLDAKPSAVEFNRPEAWVACLSLQSLEVESRLRE